ncbi:hypothetical protein FBF91_08240 [Campylobacter upsaliensis]|uniref:hypothetical protein n=1 Tax=Campylobacter upsaliensis TaxID=28080 RepID=UPI0012D26522|nr:hypothetical protein [Campylobacter upsaliensis]EAK7296985.1 hypothetical protein [Campylobacter upsaliensis]MBJ6809635.1 hypothetical protein [Campylobacter upsaliensis]
MLYWDENDYTFKKAPTEMKAYYDFLQNLQLWLGENPIKADQGANYRGVFENQAFIETEVNKVIDKFTDQFTTLRLLGYEFDKDTGELSISIYCEFDDRAIETSVII